MNNAINLALKSLSLNEVPVGCVIADNDDKIIGYGYNSSIKIMTQHLMRKLWQ